MSTAIHPTYDYSHWQKSGKPGTPGEIYDAHFINNFSAKPCELGLCNDRDLGFDYFNPKNNFHHPWWANIDNEMREEMKPYIHDFVEEQWADWYE